MNDPQVPKTTLIEWIPITDRRPQDREYVLGAFLSSTHHQILVFAMWYFAEEDVFMDADEEKRGAETREPILYWAPVPDFPGA